VERQKGGNADATYRESGQSHGYLLLLFFWSNKWWWLTPMIFILLLFGGLVIFAQSSAIAPFIYTLF
jgi:Family of unknown function (DUF5989)